MKTEKRLGEEWINEIRRNEDARKTMASRCKFLSFVHSTFSIFEQSAELCPMYRPSTCRSGYTPKNFSTPYRKTELKRLFLFLVLKGMQIVLRGETSKHFTYMIFNFTCIFIFLYWSIRYDNIKSVTEIIIWFLILKIVVKNWLFITLYIRYIRYI